MKYWFKIPQKVRFFLAFPLLLLVVVFIFAAALFAALWGCLILTIAAWHGDDLDDVFGPIKDAVVNL